MSLSATPSDRNISETLFRGSALFLSYMATRLACYVLLPDTAFIFPAAAVAVSLLFFGGMRLWLFTAASVAMTEILINGLTLHSIAFSIATVLSIVVGGFLLRHRKIDPVFRRKRDAYNLIGTALITAAILPLTMALFQKPDSLLIGFVMPYIGSALTFIVVASFLLRIIVKPRFNRTRIEALEVGGVFALLIACGYFIARDHTLSFHGLPFSYVIFFPLTWIALRLRPRFVTLALLIVFVSMITWLRISGEIFSPDILIHQEVQVLMLSVIFLIITTQEEDRRASQNLSLSQMQTLENAVERVRSESKAKEDFIAVLAHELRNPLAPIVSTIEFLKLKGPRDDEEAEALDIMDDRTKTIRRILEDLLDVSRIQAGTPLFAFETIDLREALHASILSTAHYRTERHQELLSEISRVPLWIAGDRVRIEQIFTNLLSNASKYSESGDMIKLRARLIDGAVEVMISDTGIGISPDSMQLIFLPFQQIIDSQRSTTGLGIGLALVKSFAETHGGSIHVDSAGLGRGSSFTVRIPETAAPVDPGTQSAEARPESLSNASGPRVLVVDDNNAAASSMGKLLQAMQFQVAYAFDGIQALDIAEKFPQDVILLDLNMPGLNGVEVALKLRNTGHRCKIVALSGYGEKNARQIYGDISMFDAFLVKPINASELRSIISSP